MRAVDRLQRDGKRLSFNAGGQWWIYDYCITFRVRLEQTCRDGRTLRWDKPLLVNLVRWERRQVAGKEDQITILALIDSFPLRLRGRLGRS